MMSPQGRISQSGDAWLQRMTVLLAAARVRQLPCGQRRSTRPMGCVVDARHHQFTARSSARPTMEPFHREGSTMQLQKRHEVTVPELVLVATTRGLLGAGLGLLLADRLSAPQRRTAGYVMTGVGLLSTVPLLVQIFGRGRELRPDGGWDPDSVRRMAAETRLTH
jgi:hypothetical protein